MKKLLLTTAIAAVTTSLAVIAEETASGKMEQVIVSAHRMDVPLARIGSSVSVVTEQDIIANGAPNVAGILRTLPGISASVSGGAGKDTALRIRGEEAYRTLVLIDGVKISDPTSTQVAPRIEQISSANIERIEVLRGPQGMMYGADAGGVVNIITKQASSELEGGVSVEAGRYGTQNVAADVRGKLGIVDYALMASDDSTDGFNAKLSDTQSKDDDGYDNTTLHGNIGVAISDELSARLVLREVDTENEYDGCFDSMTFTIVDDCSNDYEQSLAKLSFNYEQAKMSHSLSYSENKVETQHYSNGVASFGYEGKIEQAQYFGAVKFSEKQSLSFAVDSEEQSNTGENVEQDQFGILLEYQAEVLGSLSYSLGVRYDDNDAFGEHATYRATTAYWQNLSDNNGLKYKASYGTGFRAPSLYELAYNASAWAYAPATNQPLDEEENSEGFDVGIEYHSAQGHFAELVYFYQEIDNAIIFDLEGFSGYLQDDGRSRSQGVELGGEYVLSPALSVVANATYNEATDTDGDRRVRRPLWVANLGLQGLFMEQRLQVNLDVRGSRGSVDIYAKQLENYEVVNINVAYSITPELEAYVRGENIFDKGYQEVGDYNASGAAYYLGARYRFGS